MVLLGIGLTCFLSCKTAVDPLFYSHYETRVIAPEGSDIYILRVQGKGRTKTLAQQNALMNAVRDVIFTDIHASYGTHTPLMRLVNDPSQEQKNEAFFSKFFSENGEYLKYATLNKKNKNFYSDGSYYVALVDITINRGALKKYLSQFNIQ